MKALTIHQPYSELILRGEKRCENRRWWTGYRGPLLVHAGKNREWLAAYEEAIRLGRQRPSRDPLPKEMDFGALVGVVKVTACVKLEDVGACRQVGFHYPGCSVIRTPKGRIAGSSNSRVGLQRPFPTVANRGFLRCRKAFSKMRWSGGKKMGINNPEV
jgi:hypothetical protein